MYTIFNKYILVNTNSNKQTYGVFIYCFCHHKCPLSIETYIVYMFVRLHAVDINSRLCLLGKVYYQ